MENRKLTITEIEQLSKEEAPNPYEEADLDDVIGSAMWQGNIDVAKDAILIIKKLQNEILGLRQELNSYLKN